MLGSMHCSQARSYDRQSGVWLFSHGWTIRPGQAPLWRAVPVVVLSVACLSTRESPRTMPSEARAAPVSSAMALGRRVRAAAPGSAKATCRRCGRTLTRLWRRVDTTLAGSMLRARLVLPLRARAAGWLVRLSCPVNARACAAAPSVVARRPAHLRCLSAVEGVGGWTVAASCRQPTSLCLWMRQSRTGPSCVDGDGLIASHRHPSAQRRPPRAQHGLHTNAVLRTRGTRLAAHERAEEDAT
jgi:hypothetical protein